MKKILVLLLIVGASFAYAQDDKKEWAKKLKELDPLSLKQLYQERDNLKADVISKEQELTNLRQELETLKANSIKMPAESGEKDITSQGYERGKTNTQGVVFKVQIGAFKNKDLTKYFENSKNFSGDVDPDGTKKYTLGYFSEYWEADRFKKYLREMGVKDAWIVPYKNGERLNIKDVLEGVIN